jgi:hypothetical protein
MYGRKKKVSARRPQGDARAFIVQRGCIECFGQVAPLGGADRRTVQPVDAVKRRHHRRERPLVVRRVGQ